MPSRSFAACLLLSALVLVQCSVPPTESPRPPEPRPSSDSTSTEDVSPTEWALALETRLASTQLPDPYPTLQTGSLSSSGPWLVFSDGEALWGTDGEVVHEIYRPPFLPTYGIGYSAAPSGGVLAFAASPPGSTQASPELELYFATFPQANPLAVSELLSQAQLAALSTEVPGDPQESWGEQWFRIEQMRAAISRPNGLAWSPDGRLLAFVAALHNTNTDLYVYDPRAGRVTRLTTGPYQTAQLLWSPTGKYIAHAATSDINIGRNGPLLIVDGLWAAEPSTITVTSLAGPGTELVQWIGPDTVLVSTAAEVPCASSGLTSVNVATGRTRTLWPGSFDSVAADPSTGTVLVGIDLPDESLAYADVCPPYEPNGLYLLRPESPPVRISDYENTLSVQPPIVWSDAGQSFMAKTPTGVAIVSPSGEVAVGADLENVPLPSPSLEYMAVEDSESALAILTPGGTVRTETTNPVCQAIWHPDGSAIYFTDRETLYAASAPNFATRPLFRSDGWGLCDSPFVWLTP